MTPFYEAPLDPDYPLVVRRTLLAQPAEYFQPYFEGRNPTSIEKAKYVEEAVRRMTPARAFVNSLYRVELFETPASGPHFIHLGIQRLDQRPYKEWKHLQQIKNEIVGEEYEAIELFPAESRLVDAGHQYHLWVHRDPTFRFPVGWWLRVVRDSLVPLIQT